MSRVLAVPSSLMRVLVKPNDPNSTISTLTRRAKSGIINLNNNNNNNNNNCFTKTRALALRTTSVQGIRNLSQVRFNESKTIRRSIHTTTTTNVPQRQSSFPVCLIAGAGEGLGQALAKKFASEGFTVVCTRRNLEPLHALCKEINESNSNSPNKPVPIAIPFACDWRDEEAANSLVKKVENEVGQIHVAGKKV